MHKIDEINKEIWDLWKKNPEKIGARVPKFVVPRKKPDTLLFLGLNPSFPKLNEQDIERIKTEITLKYPDDFEWKSSPLAHAFNLELVKKHAKIHDADARENYSWFRRLNCLAKKLGIEQEDYGHIDLYLWMDAKSHKIQKKLKKLAFKDFIEQQSNLTIRLLAIHKPRMIVCVYKNAWDHFLKFYPLVGKVKKYKLEGKNGNAVLQYADIKIVGVNNSVAVIGCPDLPRGYGKYSIRNEHLKQFFTFATKRYTTGSWK